MNLSPLIKRTVLIAVALVLEKIDKKITEEQNNLEATQKPLEAPKMNSPTKYTRERLKPSIDDPRPVYANGIFKLTVDDNGIITSISNGSSKEDMQVYRYPPLTAEQVRQKLEAQSNKYYNPNTGIITSTTANSKYSPEQLQSFYKINPYTNL